jgi:regulator of cell morphogenesis and NO signaling
MLSNQLKSIVLENIARVKVLNDFGIEYSNDRDKTVEEIADSKGLDLYALVQKLSEAGDFKQLKKSDFIHWTQNQIIDDILIRQHVVVGELKGYFINKSSSLNRTFGKEYKQLVELRDLLRNVLEDLSSHIEREENTLFPAIKHIEYKGKDSMLSESALFSSIITLIQNHEHANEDVALIEKYTNEILLIPNLNAEIEAYCNEVLGLCKALNQHIFIEDEILFKMVVEM